MVVNNNSVNTDQNKPKEPSLWFVVAIFLCVKCCERARYVKTPSKGRFFDGVFGGVFLRVVGGLFGGGFGGASYHVGVGDGGVGFFHLGFERAEAVRDGDAVIAVVEA